MNTIISFLSNMGSYLTPWLHDISAGMVACFLVIFGADINKFIKKKLGAQNFILRTFVFIIVNAFVFGLVIIKLSPWVEYQLGSIPTEWMFLVVVGVFVFFGVWAQKNGQA